MTAIELFMQLNPEDADGAELVILAGIEQTGEVDPDLLRTLARMQSDPEAFVKRIAALVEELDAAVDVEKDFDEGLHPRDDHGRFASGSGGGETVGSPGAATTSTTDKPAKEKKPKEKKPREKKPSKEKEPEAAPRVLTPEQERVARQTPEHWLPSLEKKYAGSTMFKTGRTEALQRIATGKASMYRGCEIPIDDARAKLEELKSIGVQLGSTTSSMAEMQKWAKNNLGKEFDTIGEALEYVEAKRPLATETKNKSVITGLKVYAALVGHAEAIAKQRDEHWRKTGLDAQPIKVGEVKVRGVLPIAAPIPPEHANGVVATTVNLFEKMTGPSITHPDIANHDVVIEPRSDGTWRGCYIKPSPGGGLKGAINIGTGSLTTVVHEWGHALEEMNPQLGLRAQTFLRMRTGSDDPQRLKDLSPVSDYESNEVAKPDGFYEPYMGKIYSGGATEITSMLVQQLVVHYGLEHVVERDEEAMHFLFGQLQGEPPEKPKRAPSKRRSSK